MNTTQLTPAEFLQFQKLIFELSGIRVPENKVMLLSNRIRRRVKAMGVDDFRAYLTLISSSDGRSELDGLLNAVTTNETSFFRTQKHFDWLANEFIDSLRKQVRTGQRAKSVRIWSAACSSGEEPYSIAMCLSEKQSRLPDWKIEIHATDISEDSLAKARAGMYAGTAAKAIPERLRKRYFDYQPDTDQWTVRPMLKDLVRIYRHNLMEPNRHREFDCILIRNVLIYFNRESKQVVIENLVRSLAVGGYLIVGPSEGIFDMLGMLTKRSAFLFQKES